MTISIIIIKSFTLRYFTVNGEHRSEIYGKGYVALNVVLYKYTYKIARKHHISQIVLEIGIKIPMVHILHKLTIAFLFKIGI